jgi:hypothetical protein
VHDDRLSDSLQGRLEHAISKRQRIAVPPNSHLAAPDVDKGDILRLSARVN